MLFFLIPPTQAVLCVADCMLSLQWNLNDIIANQGLKEITQAWQGGFSRKVLFFFLVAVNCEEKRLNLRSVSISPRAETCARKSVVVANVPAS